MSANEEIDNIKTEAKILASTIEIETNKLSESFALQKKELESVLANLKDLNVMLQSIPKKLETQIKDIVPDIAAKLDILNEEKIEKIKENYQTVCKEHLEYFDAATDKIKFITGTIDKFSKKTLIRFFLGIIISSIISIGCATYGAFYMMQRFPTRVIIDNPENIILHNSEVGLWGTENVKVLKGKGG